MKGCWNRINIFATGTAPIYATGNAPEEDKDTGTVLLGRHSNRYCTVSWDSTLEAGNAPEAAGTVQEVGTILEAAGTTPEAGTILEAGDTVERRYIDIYM